MFVFQTCMFDFRFLVNSYKMYPQNKCISKKHPTLQHNFVVLLYCVYVTIILYKRHQYVLNHNSSHNIDMKYLVISSQHSHHNAIHLSHFVTWLKIYTTRETFQYLHNTEIWLANKSTTTLGSRIFIDQQSDFVGRWNSAPAPRVRDEYSGRPRTYFPSIQSALKHLRLKHVERSLDARKICRRALSNFALRARVMSAQRSLLSTSTRTKVPVSFVRSNRTCIVRL